MGYQNKSYVDSYLIDSYLSKAFLNLEICRNLRLPDLEDSKDHPYKISSYLTICIKFVKFLHCIRQLSFLFSFWKLLHELKLLISQRIWSFSAPIKKLHNRYLLMALKNIWSFTYRKKIQATISLGLLEKKNFKSEILFT